MNDKLAKILASSFYYAFAGTYPLHREVLSLPDPRD